MQTSPLHSKFGAEVSGINLRDVTEENLYPDVRSLFEKHSLLLFKNQNLNDEEQLFFANLFGPIEDRSNIRMDGPAEVSYGVSNLDETGKPYSKDDIRLLGLQANMLWHTDSTFLPVPALTNTLQAKVIPSSGGATEFVSTRAAFKEFDADLQQQLRSTYFTHRYSHSRAQINPELAKQEKFTMWKDQKWRAVWENPATGEESLYIASHACAVDGMDDVTGPAFIKSLMDAATKPDAIYSHQWDVGDVLLWDERALLHRGTPWPYEEQRTLSSLCTSAQASDGLASVAPQ